MPGTVVAADTLGGVSEALQRDAAAQLDTFPSAAHRERGERGAAWLLYSALLLGSEVTLRHLDSSEHAPPLLGALHVLLKLQLLASSPHRERAQVLGHLCA